MLVLQALLYCWYPNCKNVLLIFKIPNSSKGRVEECQLNNFLLIKKLSISVYCVPFLNKRYIDHLEINHDIPNCNETAIIIPISNEASTLNVLFGLQQTFCKRAGKSRQFALVAQRCNLALQPNLELIQRQTWFFVQSCRARLVFTSLH